MNNSRNRQYELQIGEHYMSLGYNVEVTPSTGDWGVDVFIEKDGDRFAIQAKNYGNCRTKISRKDMMELYGAMAYFECKGAIMVYNGAMSSTAKAVADKLGIKCLLLEFKETSNGGDLGFESLWAENVMPMAGHTLSSFSGAVQYTILSVNDSTVEFLSGGGRRNVIRKDVFKWTYERIVNSGNVRGTDIRDEFHTRFSSLVVAIFNAIPDFEVHTGRVISFKGHN